MSMETGWRWITVAELPPPSANADDFSGKIPGVYIAPCYTQSRESVLLRGAVKGDSVLPSNYCQQPREV